MVCDEHQIGQQRDRSYRCGLRRKWYWTVISNKSGCSLWWTPDRKTMWLIIQVWSTPKTILNCRDWSYHVRFLKKKTDMTMMWSIVRVCSTPKPKLNCWDISDQVRPVMKTTQDNDTTDCTSVVYPKNETELLWLIGPDVIQGEK